MICNFLNTKHKAMLAKLSPAQRRAYNDMEYGIWYWTGFSFRHRLDTLNALQRKGLIKAKLNSEDGWRWEWKKIDVRKKLSA